MQQMWAWRESTIGRSTSGLKRAGPSSSPHHGIVRLRVWPTTVEETQAALERLLPEVPEGGLKGALVVIDRTRIRVRPGRPA